MVVVGWVGGGGDLGVHDGWIGRLEVDVLKRLVMVVVGDKCLRVELNLRQTKRW